MPIRRFSRWALTWRVAASVVGVGVLLNIACIAIALSGVDLHQFLIALFLLGVGWNFLFTGSTTLSLQAYRPEEKDRAQAAINFFVFAVMALIHSVSRAVSRSDARHASIGRQRARVFIDRLSRSLSC